MTQSIINNHDIINDENNTSTPKANPFQTMTSRPILTQSLEMTQYNINNSMTKMTGKSSQYQPIPYEFFMNDQIILFLYITRHT